MDMTADDGPVDLRSDTVTMPSEEMREAARDAPVGDDVYEEDPSINRLQERAAALLGKGAGLFCPSGTMANQVAAFAHAEQGEEVIVERRSHIYGAEVGGLAATGGLQPYPLDGGEDGLYSTDSLRDAIHEESLHVAGTGLICLENTHNRAGGVAHGPAALREIAAVAAEHGIPVHLDGARIFNAAVARDVDPADLVEPVDTVMCSLSKGLGAPVGSLLVGPADTIETARRYRKRLGGGMRQAGIIAAPALVGLERWEGLAADHERAERLAAAIEATDGLSVNDPDTNILLVDVEDVTAEAETFLDACADVGVLGTAFGETTVRFCTHWDIDDAGLERAIDGIRTATAALSP